MIYTVYIYAIVYMYSGLFHFGGFAPGIGGVIGVWRISSIVINARIGMLHQGTMLLGYMYVYFSHIHVYIEDI